MNNYFFLPHQDDEIGAIGSINEIIKNRESIYFIYLTRSPKIEDTRNKESLNFLKNLKVKKKNIFFWGSRLKVNDQDLYKNLDLVYRYLYKFFKNRKIDNIYVPSYEGGHPDHDSAFVILFKYFYSRNKNFNFYSFPLYNSKLKKKFFFNFLKPLNKKKCIAIKVHLKINILLIILKIPFFFKSQLISMLFLYPFLIKSYILEKKNYIQKINNFKLSKPHTGKLYYETRKWNSWKNLKKFNSHFLNKSYEQ